MPTDKLIYFIAGEKSGDLHGGELLAALRKMTPPFSAKGIGGPSMQAQGLQPALPFEALQVMGFSDVIIQIPTLMRHFYHLASQILQDRPTAVVFIDYPGFNIRLAKHLRKKGYSGKLIHYIAPSVFAWGKGRIKTMSQTLDLLLTIFPFEPNLFAGSGLKTVFVGNPSIQELPSLKKTREPLLALFPGSRIKEILRNLPLQIEAAKHYAPEKLAISLSDPNHEKTIRSLLRHSGIQYELVPEAERYALMERAEAALAKSGTVTLELALRGCPTVVLYQLTRLNYFLAKYVFRISLPYYALPNILLNQEMYKEHYGVKISPDVLASDLQKMKDRSALISHQTKALRTLLTEKKASEEAAKEVIKIC